MSVDWEAICDEHRIRKHLGQSQGGDSVRSFGYGPNDERGRQDCADFVAEHLSCGIRVVMCESAQDPTNYERDKGDD